MKAARRATPAWLRPFRLMWEIHKWLGIVLGALVLMVAATGIVLLLKKQSSWIMPPTHTGSPGAPEAIRPLHEVYAAVFALDHPELRSESDVDRVDFRPADRVFKVRSRTGWLEIQVDAISLDVLGVGKRRSDWFEALHDGSLLGDAVHRFVMPLTAVGVVVLVVTGYLLWLWPIVVRRRARRRHAERRPPEPPVPPPRRRAQEASSA